MKLVALERDKFAEVVYVNDRVIPESILMTQNQNKIT